MAKIFVSHAGADSDWASWIGFILKESGHTPFVDRWEISGGHDIMAWMEKRFSEADHVLVVMSKANHGKTFADWERRTALWKSKQKRKEGFVLPVFVEDCEAPDFMDSISRCTLSGLSEKAAVKALEDFLTPAVEPTTRPQFPPAKHTATTTSPTFPPLKPLGLSNIPFREPEHFLGRDDALAKIGDMLSRNSGRVVVTALHGLRGVGKSTLAAVYAHQQRRNYRATWWIGAQTPSTLRADLASLGVAIGWIAKDAKEDEAIRIVLEKLRDEGDGVLLIFDNANSADEIRPYLPNGGAAKILATSNSDDWRAIATPVEIDVWLKETGADYLVSRTGREKERAQALALSEALGGLPLAHEQAGAYCARLGVGFAEYLSRFEKAPTIIMDKEKDAPADYHNRLTVAKSFALAIEEAAKRHPAAAHLIEHAALLAPEPLPLFLFLESREKFAGPLDSLDAEGLDEAIAALRTFALVDRETIEDERDSAIMTEAIRLHRLVRAVAVARLQGEARENATRTLIEALAAIYPSGVYDDPETWPRTRRLDALAMALVGDHAAPPLAGCEVMTINLLNLMGQYREAALGAFGPARPLKEKALMLAEAYYPPDDPAVAKILSSFGLLLKNLGGAENLSLARAHLIRALSINEAALDPNDENIAITLSNLATVLHDLGGAENLSLAQDHLIRAISIGEKSGGPDHPNVAIRLSNLGVVLKDLGGAENLALARDHLIRALSIDKTALGPDHPNVAIRLSNLAPILKDMGGVENLALARTHLLQAEAILRAALGAEHPRTQAAAANLAFFLAQYGEG